MTSPCHPARILGIDPGLEGYLVLTDGTYLRPGYIPMPIRAAEDGKREVDFDGVFDLLVLLTRDTVTSRLFSNGRDR